MLTCPSSVSGKAFCGSDEHDGLEVPAAEYMKNASTDMLKMRRSGEGLSATQGLSTATLSLHSFFDCLGKGFEQGFYCFLISVWKTNGVHCLSRLWKPSGLELVTKYEVRETGALKLQLVPVKLGL